MHFHRRNWRSWQPISLAITSPLGMKKSSATFLPGENMSHCSRRSMPRSTTAISLRHRDVARASVLLEVLSRVARTHPKARGQKLPPLQVQPAPSFPRFSKEGWSLHCRNRPQLSCSGSRTKRQLVLVLNRDARGIQSISLLAFPFYSGRPRPVCENLRNPWRAVVRRRLLWTKCFPAFSFQLSVFAPSDFRLLLSNFYFIISNYRRRE